MSTPADIASHPTQVSDAALFASLNLDRPGLEAVRDAVAAQDYQAASGAWADYMHERARPTPHFARDTWPAFLRRDFPQLVDPIVEGADRVVRGEIIHGTVRLPVRDGKIDWLHNPTKDTSYVSVVGSQWFMNPLGRAYLLTGHERYAQAFVRTFESWYDHRDAIIERQGGLGFNPIFRAYYPGVQSRILVDNYYCLAPSPSLPPRVHVKIMKHLLASAAFLHRQEARYRRGNQQVAAVLGLGMVGMVLPEFKSAPAWLDRCEKRMREHLLRDFHPDGGHKELCTQYHKTCLRDLAYVALTAERNGRPSFFTDPRVASHFEAAYDWLAKLVMPTGETPALHSAVFSQDWAVHLLIAARYFRRPDFLWLARRFWSRGAAPCQKAPFAFACFMVSDAIGRRALAGLSPQRPSWGSVHLDTSGFAVMRTGWAERERFLVMQYGWPNTGHAYPGALAFCLEMNRDLIATNPGSPRSYRHPAYRYCHSTRSHNVVSIDLASYGRGGFAPGGKLHACADLPGAWYVSASHRGYKALAAVHHRRMLVVKRGPIFIHDVVTGAAGHSAEWNFHTPLDVRTLPGHVAVLTGRETYQLRPAFAGEVLEVEREKRWEAVLPRDCQPDDCGRPVNVLRWVKPIRDTGARFAMALVEKEGEIETEGDAAFRIRSGKRAYVILLRGQAGSSEGFRVRTDAECACVQFNGSRPIRAWVFAGAKLDVAGSAWLDAGERASVELDGPRG